MAVNAQHGSRYGYTVGCRCADCRGAQARYQRGWRERQLYGPDVSSDVKADVFTEVRNNPSTSHFTEVSNVVGPVESAVALEIDGLPAARERPGLAAAALEMGRVLDHPRAISTKPAAVRALTEILDRLHKVGGRRGRLALVKAMTEQEGYA